jgi:hypothetical protein
MTKARLAPEADAAGYLVFKLGGAGALLGVAVGCLAGGGPALETWLTYSLSVSVAGALLGSLAWLGRSKDTTERREAPMAPAAVARAPVTERASAAPTRHISAFRALPKGTH